MTSTMRVRTEMPLLLAFAILLAGCHSAPTVSETSAAERRGPSQIDGAVPFSELEEIDGVEALKWVRERNAESEKRLGGDVLFTELKDDILQIIQAKDRIPNISLRSDETGTRVFNFWQDAKNPKGVYRTQSLEDFTAKKENWDIVFDVDAIAAKEKENWVFKGMRCAPKDRDTCLLFLSRGGGDAVVAREFNLSKKSFVLGGISLPEAKMRLSWKDDDTLWVGVPHGAETVSKSGYPITVRLWKRGEDLSKVPVVMKGSVDDVSVSGGTYRGFVRDSKGELIEQSLDMINRSVSFFQNETYILMPDGAWKMLPLPLESELIDLSHGQMLFTVKKDATAFGKHKVKTGALYAFDIFAWRENPAKDIAIEKVFEPTSKQAFQGVSVTREKTLISYLDRVRGRLAELSRKAPRKTGGAGTWSLSAVSLPGNEGALSMGFTDYREALFTLYYSDFLTPSEMYLGGRPRLVRLRETPARFDASGMKVETREAKSRDGTKVPYFLIAPKGMKHDGRTPTLIYAYGGFEIPTTPSYMSVMGKVWVERGGAYVIANIRGGGEFGPRWHQAALREKRQHAFDDLYAVGEDLIRRKITSRAHLGVRGGSNGGLLTGVALTQRPDLFGAVLSQVPLLDMLRYHKLLAGASWIEEYGDPEKPIERAALEKYSPLQNLKADGKYPEPFFTTSTRDDRVHPGHARRMVARMRELGLPVLYYENIEGGHAGAATLESRAALSAREYRYLWEKLR